MTNRACVMGHPVAHSRSPMLHGYWLRTLGIPGAYEFADVPPADFPDFFRNLGPRGFAGGNITKPHKEAAFRLVDRREPAAESIGAVNTVWYENGVLVGGNTDWLGLVLSLDALHPGWDAANGHALVLGAGGAARAVAYGLTRRGLAVTLANRTRQRADDLAAHLGTQVSVCDQAEAERRLATATILVNTTSLGMVGEPPLHFDLTAARPDCIVYDIVYIPLETDLIKAAGRRGLRTVDGLSMLLYQAVPGFAHWFGVTPDVTAEQRALLEADIRAKTGT